MAGILFAFESLKTAFAVARAVPGALKLFGGPLKTVFSLVYGVTHSAAGSLHPKDVGHILITVLSILGSTAGFSAMVVSDLASGIAWFAASAASAVVVLHKWLGDSAAA